MMFHGGTSWLTKKFNGQKFRADLEALKTFYMDRGFVNFKVDSTSVELTPDRKGIYLTIAIDEGERYRFIHSQFVVIP